MTAELEYTRCVNCGEGLEHADDIRDGICIWCKIHKRDEQ